MNNYSFSCHTAYIVLPAKLCGTPPVLLTKQLLYVYLFIYRFYYTQSLLELLFQLIFIHAFIKTLFLIALHFRLFKITELLFECVRVWFLESFIRLWCPFFILHLFTHHKKSTRFFELFSNCLWAPSSPQIPSLEV